MPDRALRGVGVLETNALLTLPNRRIRDPYVRWCGRGGAVRLPPIPIALAVLILFAGNETTTNLIGNTVLALLNHPTELAKVRANRSLVPQLIEEVLRYDGAVQGVFRVAVRDVELAGTTIPADALVFYLNGSANRDERKYAEPDRFDVLRNPRDHLAFGYGIHYCLGAQLARLEAKVALDALLFEQPPFVRTSGEVTRVDGLAVRGPKTLPLRFAA